MSIEGDDTQARAVGKFFKDRYGSLENIKKLLLLILLVCCPMFLHF